VKRTAKNVRDFTTPPVPNAILTNAKLSLNRIFIRIAGFENLNRISPQLMTVITYVSMQPDHVMNNYVDIFIDGCINAYGGGNGMTAPDGTIANMSCAKGMIERIFLSLKDALVISCMDPETCLPGYTRILTEGFSQIDHNNLTQMWNEEHLNNDEFLIANRLAEGNENRRNDEERRAFLRDDYIAFMRNKYRERGALNTATNDIINREANLLDHAGVFANMFFGGGRRTRTRRRKRKPKC
jgi:hypothetical protein